MNTYTQEAQNIRYSTQQIPQQFAQQEPYQQEEYSVPPSLTQSEQDPMVAHAIAQNTTYNFPTTPDPSVSTYVVPPSQGFTPFHQSSHLPQNKRDEQNNATPVEQKVQSTYLTDMGSVKTENYDTNQVHPENSGFVEVKETQGNNLSSEQYIDLATKLEHIETIPENEIMDDDDSRVIVVKLMLVGIVLYPIYIVIFALFNNSSDKRVRILSFVSMGLFLFMLSLYITLFFLCVYVF
ncbi:hypothetical protein EIN_097780 [Entamoeba invadens IP1]|uniref:Uncharacterized protein n=2 Tax=Entamoeba invadens TaxID=33085 RepID=A0A0A1U6P1_ENTIV|nr:hypothetical protein EIN_097780 [Entamoeba invadens IP1]ELP87491.1 hypothetical protein EIN_097780 [Entamoeba invadens IP1]BAN40671.1 hypothetical protein [Entamoeba invadens]|eukprot:XP_004254262.1 hypothetical protein EIN_097780 [Entamoeba invadens IP1]